MIVYSANSKVVFNPVSNDFFYLFDLVMFKNIFKCYIYCTFSVYIIVLGTTLHKHNAMDLIFICLCFR